MIGYVARRLVSLVFVLLGMSVLTFTISHVIPADPGAAAAGPNATGEQIAQYRRELGLDLPLYVQYVRYVGGLVLRGDLGRSILNQRAVADDIRAFLPASLELAAVAFLLCVPLGIALGTYTAVRAGRFWDAATRGFAVLGVSMPIFIVALVFQLVFYKELRWFPSGGRLGAEFAPPEVVTGFLLLDTLVRGNWPAFVSALHHVALPAATLAVANLAVVTRMTRSSLLEVLAADYIRTARSKGLTERRILRRHALKNGLIPVVTVIGLQFASMIAYVFLVEHIFSWPGIGSYAVRAILGLDVQPIMAITLLLSVIYVTVNFAVDLSYLALDPRITY